MTHEFASGDTLTMHYTGRLLSTGAKFDSSVDRGQPFQFKIGVGQVIAGISCLFDVFDSCFFSFRG